MNGKEKEEKEEIISPHPMSKDEATKETLKLAEIPKRSSTTSIAKAKKAVQKELDGIAVELGRLRIVQHKLTEILSLLSKLEK